MAILARHLYQRQKICFETELEGLIPSYGDLVAVSHDLFTWSSTGTIEFFENNFVITSEPLPWKDGEIHIIGFRSSQGNFDGPYICVRGDSDYHVILTGDVNFVYNSYIFGIKDGNFVKDCLVSAIIPRKSTVEIQVVNDCDEIYNADFGQPPPIQENFTVDTGPSITGLSKIPRCLLKISSHSSQEVIFPVFK